MLQLLRRPRLLQMLVVQWEDRKGSSGGPAGGAGPIGLEKLWMAMWIAGTTSWARSKSLLILHCLWNDRQGMLCTAYNPEMHEN